MGCYTVSMSYHSVRVALGVLLSAVTAICLSSCWYLQQAACFLADRARAAPVEAVASRAGTSATVLELLARVESIRMYASARIGLEPSKNYTRYVDTGKKHVAVVVSACAADSFTRYYWKYPVLGALPYKGFYREPDAEKEAARLRKAGLDVFVRTVDAFSSLGYFSDPLYAFMADYREDELAELLIHESAHATLFIKGADQFNEEFATFTGRKGAEQYIADKYGAGSPLLASRRARADEALVFIDYLKSTAVLLEGVYTDQHLSREEKLARKADILRSRAEQYRFKAESLFSTRAYISFDMGAVNNAYLDLYRLYEEDLGLFESWFEQKAGGDLPVFISSLRLLAKAEGKNIKQAMERTLASR